MKNYRSKALTFYNIVDAQRAARRVIIDNEAHPATIAKKLALVNKEAKQKMAALKYDLELEVKIYEGLSKDELDKVSRRGKDPNRTGYVQVNAGNAFEGLSSEEIVEKYPGYIAGLHPDDKPYKWVVDELVRSKIRGKGDTEVLNHLIGLNMTAEEKVAAAAVANVQALKDSHLTIAGLMEGHIDRIAEGIKPADLDVAETFDGLVEGHGKYKPEADPPAAPNNPYEKE